MPVTIRDIANKIGLSKPTVTRILGKDAHLFRPETQKLVFDAARELGYRPNAAARAIGTGSFGCAALLMGYDSRRSDLPVPLLIGLQDELAAQGMHLAVARLPDEKLTDEGVVPKVLRESMADGLIINYTHNIPPKMLEMIRAQSEPVVWVNSDLSEDCVRPDDVDGARWLTELVIARGHRRVLYAKFDTSTHYSTVERVKGYEAAMKAAGLKPEMISREVTAEEQPRLIREMLLRSDRPTCVIARPEDVPAFAIVAASMGMSVPKDLSIASITGQYFRLMGKVVTSAIVPSYAEGVEAVRMLIAKKKAQKKGQPPKPVKSKRVAFEQCPGETLM
jgi:LacI family transcriptional regulator